MSPARRWVHQYSSTRVERLAIVFTLSVILLFGAAVAWQAQQAYRQNFDDTRVNTENLARAVAQHAQDIVKQADQILYAMVERAEWDGTGPEQMRRVQRMLVQQAAATPQLHGMFIYDINGNWLASSLPQAQAHGNSDREYFTYHRTHGGKGLHIGPVIRSRTTGEFVIPISRRIDDEQGQFAGVALVTFRVEYFLRFYESFDLGTDGLLLLALRDGTILVRRPYSPDVLGTSIADGRVFAELLPHQPAGSEVFASKVDRVERQFSYRALEGDIPLVVEAAVASKDIRGRWLREITGSLIILVLVVVGMAGFGWALMRQIRNTLRSEEALRQARDELEKLAMQDGLTGLANRRRFDDAIAMEVNRACRNRTCVALILIDIDHFKRYNDVYGHLAGDACIRAVAGAVSASANRAGEVAARYGGEELAILLPGLDLPAAIRLADRMLQTVRQLGIRHEGNPAGIVTASAGVHACVPEQGGAESVQALIRRADEALYSAKAAGRNTAMPTAD